MKDDNHILQQENQAFSPDKVWFTSDSHFFHSNVIEYSHRPFSGVNEMNEEMIRRWNSVVHRDHTVFHLGDFCLGTPEQWNYILDRLKGKIILIVGNHDSRQMSEDLIRRFELVTPQLRIRVGHQKIYLNHFPFLCFSGENYGDWQLFGHIHTNPYAHNVIDEQRLSLLLPNQYDVGVDNNDFTPVSFRRLQEIIKAEPVVKEKPTD